MITNSHRPIAKINPVPQTLACCMIISEEVEFRNKIPGGGVLGPHRQRGDF
jgi:hypothetical protein